MRSLFLVSVCSIFILLPGPGNAGESSLPKITILDNEKHLSANPKSETYRGHFLDLSALAGRKDFTEMASALRHQADTVEDVGGLSPNLQDFFRSIPTSVNEDACLDFIKDKDGKNIETPQALLHAACYTSVLPEVSRNLSDFTIWDSGGSQWVNSDRLALSFDTNRGAILVRPIMLRSSSEYSRPILLHELLHAYHHLKMPQGYKNAGVLFHYKSAKDKTLFPAEAYLMTNESEFFAVTASVFLYGADGPITRSNIKEKQPDYYRYLVNLFGFDPDRAPGTVPVASAN